MNNEPRMKIEALKYYKGRVICEFRLETSNIKEAYSKYKMLRDNNSGWLIRMTQNNVEISQGVG
jgi:hypothetical protein